MIGQIVLLKLGYAANKNDSLLLVLDQVIKNKAEYDEKRLKEIDTYKQELKFTSRSLNDTYETYNKIFDAYKSFVYDSAYVYCKKLNEVAHLLNDTGKINDAKLNLAFVLLSAGIFREVLDVLDKMDSKALNQQQRIDRFRLISLAYLNIAEYNGISDYSVPNYLKGISYCDSAINASEKGSYNYISGVGLKYLSSAGKEKEAFKAYSELVKFKQTYRDSAINYSCLGMLYMGMNKPDLALPYLIRSAIIDNKNSTKESTSLTNIAIYLFKNGNTNAAFNYINNSINDANFYGAKFRAIQISRLIPIIQKEKVDGIEKQKQSLKTYAGIITVLVIVIVFFVVANVRQVKKLAVANTIISEKNNDLNLANESLMQVNDKIDQANRSLSLLNLKLNEANIIKDEYIGSFFKSHSEYINKLDRFKRSIEKFIKEKRHDEMMLITNRLNTDNEWDNLHHNFDRVFLNIFPDFVTDFNALFDAGQQIQLADGHLMNTELRIFALIRLNIDENEAIAEILNYSVNTIYTYKTKVKNRSLIANEEFENTIMQFRAFKNISSVN